MPSASVPSLGRARVEATPAARTGAGAHGEPRSGAMLVLIGVFKLAKTVTLVALGIAATRAREGSLDARAWQLVSELRVDSNNHWVHAALARIAGVDVRELHRLAIGTFVYAALFAIEGTGLVLRTRWGEIATICITGSFLPLEAWELARRFTFVRLFALIVNLAIVVYLVVRLRRERRER